MLDYFKDLLTKKHMPEFVLTALFVLYLVMGYQLPDAIANLIDTTLGKILVILIALMLFAYSNPVLGVLALLVSYQLINRFRLFNQYYRLIKQSEEK